MDQADGRGEEGRGRAEEHHHCLCVRRQFEQRRQPRYHEHAGGHHGRRVNQCRNRRRALHGVGQPGVQQELGRFAHCPHEQQYAGQRQRVGVPAEKVDGLAGQLRGTGENGFKVGRADQHENGKNTERETEVADTVDNERFDRRGIRRRFVVPESDQQIAGQPDALPAKEELHQIVCGHQHQHREGEQREIAEEARTVRILVHVADGIDMHERRDRVDHDQHHGRKRIYPQRPGYLQIA